MIFYVLRSHQHINSCCLHVIQVVTMETALIQPLLTNQTLESILMVL